MASRAAFRVRHCVIGAGVVGLAAAARLSRMAPTVVLEKNLRAGEETSSRNSEVIHAGIYYPPHSLKTRTCIKGRQMLYELCERQGIRYNKIGKWIVGAKHSDAEYLNQLKTRCDTLGVPIRWVSSKEIHEKEPAIAVSVAVESPETGIIDSHAYLKYLQYQIEENGGVIAFDSPVVGIERLPDLQGYLVTVGGNSPCTFQADTVINAAGLHADKVAALAMGDACPYKLHYLKGYYFGYSGRSLVSRLIYPIPDQHLKTLGVHVTIDLQNRMRFGPDAHWVDKLDYSFEESHELRKAFYDAVKSYMPNVKLENFYPDYTGIRPKLAGPGEPFRDFVIEEESSKQFPGLVNLIGIESPGLTASLAIAEHVAKLVGYNTQVEI